MYIEITAVTSRPATDASVYLVHTLDALSDYEFSDNELAFLKRRFHEKTRTVQLITPEKTVMVVVSPLRPDFNDLEILRQAGSETCGMMRREKVQTLFFLGAVQDAPSTDAFLEGILLSDYTFQKYKTDATPQNTLHIYASAWERAAGHYQNLKAVAQAVYMARHWVNEPVSTLSTAQFTQEAMEAAQQYGFGIKILGQQEIAAEKMGGLLGVNRGSIDPPSFLILEHTPAGKSTEAPIVLVGKGVVFDTGGINLKTVPGSLDHMKCDMGGAAAVLGTFVAAAQTQLNIRLIGLVPITDNRPGKNAIVPGDILTLRNGTTVEVKNTDAEGRLILADALCYAEDFRPAVVITLATLTGSAVATLGSLGMAAMGTAPDWLFNLLQQEGDRLHERIARFPFWSEYDESLHSEVADVSNLGGKEAGAITAGKFLARFTTSPFVHLDIAGVAFLTKAQGYRPTGGTGAGVRLMHGVLEALIQKSSHIDQ